MNGDKTVANLMLASEVCLAASVAVSLEGSLSSLRNLGL
jgi:hypothetical protein